MFCNQCGTNIPDNSEFCFKCGAPVPTEEKIDVVNTPQPQPAPQPVDVQPPVVPSEDTLVTQKKKSKKPLIIGITAGVVILIGIILTLCLTVFNKDDSKTEPLISAEKIVGTWYEIGETGYSDYKNADEYRYYGYIGSEWVFNSDGTFSVMYKYDRPDDEGTYRIDGDTVIIHFDGEPEMIFNVAWADGRLVLAFHDGGGYEGVILTRDPSDFGPKGQITDEDAKRIAEEHLAESDWGLFATATSHKTGNVGTDKDTYIDDFITQNLNEIPMLRESRKQAEEIFRENLNVAYDTISYEIEDVKVYGGNATVYFIMHYPGIGASSLVSDAYDFFLDREASDPSNPTVEEEVATFVETLDQTGGDYSDYREQARCSLSFTITPSGETINYTYEVIEFLN